MKTSGIYQLPLEASVVTEIVHDNLSHQGVYKGSVDFAVPIGTIVLAAREGLVTRVRDDSDQYGNDPTFGPLVNYLSVQHGDGEISEYLHLDKGSARVQTGDTVTAGQPIAHTGLSGWLTAPHLHFMVYQAVATPADFRCKQIVFAA